MRQGRCAFPRLARFARSPRRPAESVKSIIARACSRRLRRRSRRDLHAPGGRRSILRRRVASRRPLPPVPLRSAPPAPRARARALNHGAWTRAVVRSTARASAALLHCYTSAIPQRRKQLLEYVAVAPQQQPEELLHVVGHEIELEAIALLLNRQRVGTFLETSPRSNRTPSAHDVHLSNGPFARV